MMRLIESLAHNLLILKLKLIGNFTDINNNELVKSRIIHLTVIPAKAGIQSFQVVADRLDSGFHRSDDFLQVHQD